MFHKMNAIFTMLLMSVSIGARADVFIGAHPDDIELFMNKNASVDIYSGIPTVLIVLTAGDAGNGTGGLNLHNIPYYRSRLTAHEYAARYWASLVGGPVSKTVSGTRMFGGHAIERSTVGLVTIYNLNLPDGGDGGGYAATGYQSLTRLVARQIPSITSIDGSNSYTIDDLKGTLRLIIQAHSAGVPNVFVNYQDYDTAYNQGDHPDHTASGQLIRFALSDDPAFHCVTQVLYQDYITGNYAQNLSESERNIHVGTWGALNVGLTNSGNANIWDPTHNNWLGKQYAREIPGGVCAF